MNIVLTQEETRVLGCLMEKEITTPEYYPLSLHALTAACNQKSCRDPMVSYDDRSTARALESLRDKQLAALVSEVDARVPKYKQHLTGQHPFGPPATAVLTELLLRGPQTIGELKSRASRMHPFKDAAEVQAAMDDLTRRTDGPWVMLLPRRPGQKDARYAHLLNGPIAIDEDTGAPATEAAVLEVRQEGERIARLEKEVTLLRADLEQVRQQMVEFRKQFE